MALAGPFTQKEHMSTQQPEALRLADALMMGNAMLPAIDLPEAADELRRLHAEVQDAHARIESLQDAVIRAESQAERYANPRLIAKRDELLADMKAARQSLQVANDTKNGPINDTIWHGEAETLFDFMDYAITKAEGREA